VTVFDSTAIAVLFPGQGNQTPEPRVLVAAVRPADTVLEDINVRI